VGVAVGALGISIEKTKTRRVLLPVMGRFAHT